VCLLKLRKIAFNVIDQRMSYIYAKIRKCFYPRFQVIEDNSQMEFLRSQLADCQEKLHKLDWMEDKLRVLEERLIGKVIIDEKDWNNLLSRVLLLETELLLQSKKVY